MVGLHHHAARIAVPTAGEPPESTLEARRNAPEGEHLKTMNQERWFVLDHLGRTRIYGAFALSRHRGGGQRRCTWQLRRDSGGITTGVNEQESSIEMGLFKLVASSHPEVSPTEPPGLARSWPWRGGVRKPLIELKLWRPRDSAEKMLEQGKQTVSKPSSSFPVAAQGKSARKREAAKQITPSA